MPKYTVRVARDLTESMDVVVDAVDADTAKEKALEVVGRYGENVQQWQVDEGNAREVYLPDDEVEAADATPRPWCIVNESATESWSNDWGWVSLYDGDSFTDEERKCLNLPEGGRWQMLRDLSSWQFLRVLCAIVSVGAVTESTLDSMANLLDMDTGDIRAIISGAVTQYERAASRRGDVFYTPQVVLPNDTV